MDYIQYIADEAVRAVENAIEWVEDETEQDFPHKAEAVKLAIAKLQELLDNC